MSKHHPTTIPALDADFRFWQDCLTAIEAENTFQRLLSDITWCQDTITLFGKTHPLPRLQAWYGDDGCDYCYSGLGLAPTPWNKELLSLKKQVEEHCQSTFNSVLANLYRHGQDSNGWHSDDEKELGEQPIIASLSLGATRRFKLRHKFQKELPTINLNLTSGSLLCMSGLSQSHWQHTLPKTARNIGPRINLTFRKIINGTC